MNETVRIRLQVDGAAARIEQFSKAGVVMNGETSASPRGLAISLQPGNSITEFRLRRVRMIQDWPPGSFKFNVSMEDGAIVCRGVDPLSLPIGRYKLRMLISDLDAKDQPLDVDVPDSAASEVTARFKTNPRNIRLTTPVDQFDEKIKAIVSDAASRIDGMDIPSWLAGPARASRKACLLNILAKARAGKGPLPKSNLIDGLKSVLFAEVDRIYVSASNGFLANLQTLAKDPAKPVYYEGPPKAAMHRRLLTHIGPERLNLESDAQLFTLQSYRQEGKPTMQAVVAIPPGGDPTRMHYADLDIDLGNPLQDLDGLFTHFGEILDPGQTDHLALGDKFAVGATADFSYYKVVKA